MWIGGRRRGGAKDLANHLQRTDENESVHVRELEGFSFSELTGANLEKAIKQMEAIGYGKGDKRNLYHTIIAPAYGETLTPEQRYKMVEHYAEGMGFQGYQRAVVEHWKKGKQHFHLVFNIIDPVTGITDELKWTRRKEWDISRELEVMFGLKVFVPKGKAAKTASMQRGERSGLDPRKARKTVTAIYKSSKTGQEFVASLEKAGFSLTRGRRNQLVLVDPVGDTHGLMRLIEGAGLADLRKKFPELGKMQFRTHADLVKERKPVKPRYAKPRRFIHPRQVRQDIRKAYRGSKTGVAFAAAVKKQGYELGRGKKGYAVIDGNGNQYELSRLLGEQTAKRLNTSFPDFTDQPLRPASTIIRSMKSQTGRADAVSAGVTVKVSGHVQRGGATCSPSLKSKAMLAMFHKAAQRAKYHQEEQKKIEPIKPIKPAKSGGWPSAAVRDWLAWGYKDPAAFFAKWPELAPDGLGPSPR